MKKTILISMIIATLLLISPFVNGFSLANFFKIGVSGKVIDLSTSSEQYKLKISYMGYKNYTDYNWKLAKKDYLKGKANFYWKINDFAEAVKISTKFPVLISQSSAILAFVQVPIGSCFKCKEVYTYFPKKEYVSLISAIMEGNTEINVFIGKDKVTKQKYTENYFYKDGSIKETKTSLGKISDYISPEEIIGLNKAKYTLSIDNPKLLVYFNDTRTTLTKNINAAIIIERVK